MRTLIGVLLLGLCLAERVHFNGYQVWDVFINSPDDADFLMNQQALGLLDVAGSITRSGSGTITIAPKFVRLVSVQLRERGITWSVQIEDLERLVEAERQRHEIRTQAYNPADFNTLADNYHHMVEYVANCAPKGLQCTITIAGNSYGGTPINIYKISTGENKPIVWIDATIHAREWLSTTTAVRIFDHIIEEYGNDADVTSMLNTHDFWIMPIGNPDGYNYSWTNFRLQRKNRRPQAGGCIGVDLNRNFDFRWGRQGVSTDPCNDIYCGPSGASEPETQAYQNAITSVANRMTTLITLHSFGQMWMYPWGNREGFSSSRPCERADDHNQMVTVAKAAADAILATTRRRWDYGTSCEVIYATTGATDDWAKGAAGVKYTFNPEVRGTYFVVPASEIDPSFRETWAATVSMVRTIDGLEGVQYPLNKK